MVVERLVSATVSLGSLLSPGHTRVRRHQTIQSRRKVQAGWQLMIAFYRILVFSYWLIYLELTQIHIIAWFMYMI